MNTITEDIEDLGIPCDPHDPSFTGTLPQVMQAAQNGQGYHNTAAENWGPFGALGAGFGGGPPITQARNSSERPLAARDVTPTGSTSFIPTLPYRNFAIPSLNFGAQPPPITPQCNAQLNPTAFVVNHVQSFVTRNNLCTGAIVAKIQMPDGPLQLGVTPDGKWAIVTSYYNAISFINTDTNAVAKIIQTDGDTFPSGIAIGPDGSYALVTSLIDDNPALLVLDLQKQAIAFRIRLDRPFPQSVFLNPDATLAWVTYPLQNVVEVIDLITGAVNYGVPVQAPLDVVFNRTGTVAYISSLGQGSVLAIDTKTYSIINNILTGPGAGDMLLSPDGRFLSVNNYNDNSVTVIETASQKKISTTPVAGPPLGSALIPFQ